MVDEKNAFQVVVLVLDHPGQHAPGLQLLRPELPIQVADADGHGPLDHLPDVRNGQTALLEAALLLAGPDDFRVNEEHGHGRERLPLGFQLLLHGSQVHHKNALPTPHLRRGQANARGRVHGLDHVVEQLLQLGRIGGHRLRPLTQNRISVYVNRQYHVCPVQF